jgi:hypothetical protein
MTTRQPMLASSPHDVLIRDYAQPHYQARNQGCTVAIHE